MKTKLEQIKTAEELITFITAFAIPTDTESICRMQDIIGHTSQDELIRLANDNGQKKAEDGSIWSTGRRGTQKEMLALLYTIWNWEDATRFYNNYVNPITMQNAEKAKQVDAFQKKAKEFEKSAETIKEKWQEAETRAYKAEEELKEAQTEIQRLKAMLFDYMTKTA